MRNMRYNDADEDLYAEEVVVGEEEGEGEEK